MLLSNENTQLGPIDSQGHTPLWDAIVMGDHVIAAMLRAKGAPVQPNIATQLCRAAAQNDVKFIELLLMHNLHVLARVRTKPHAAKVMCTCAHINSEPWKCATQ
jgi:ankyrin repeat protein